MFDGDNQAWVRLQALRQLFSKIDGAVLATGASKADHKMVEAALSVTANAGLRKRKRVGEETFDRWLVREIGCDRSIFAGQQLKLPQATGVRQAAGVKDEAAAVSAGVVRKAAVE